MTPERSAGMSSWKDRLESKRRCKERQLVSRMPRRNEVKVDWPEGIAKGGWPTGRATRGLRKYIENPDTEDVELFWLEIRITYIFVKVSSVDRVSIHASNHHKTT